MHGWTRRGRGVPYASGCSGRYRCNVVHGTNVQRAFGLEGDVARCRVLWERRNGHVGAGGAGSSTAAHGHMACLWASGPRLTGVLQGLKQSPQAERLRVVPASAQAAGEGNRALALGSTANGQQHCVQPKVLLGQSGCKLMSAIRGPKQLRSLQCDIYRDAPRQHHSILL